MPVCHNLQTSETQSSHRFGRWHQCHKYGHHMLGHPMPLVLKKKKKKTFGLFISLLLLLYISCYKLKGAGATFWVLAMETFMDI